MTSPVEPPVDILAILAAMQDQLDDLTAAVAAQQASIDRITARLDGAGAAPPGRSR